MRSTILSVFVVSTIAVSIGACQTAQKSSPQKAETQQNSQEKEVASANQKRADKCGHEITPLPSDLKIETPGSGVPSEYSRFSGLWAKGYWGGYACGALAVEQVFPDGTAQIVYSWGPAKGENFSAGHTREKAKIKDGVLSFYLRGQTEVRYLHLADDKLQGKYYRNGVWTIVLTKQKES